MARVSYERGIKCKRCGKLIVTVDRFSRYLICQDCGAYLGDFDSKNMKMELTTNAEVTTVKVTHKLFRDIYEEVKQMGNKPVNVYGVTEYFEQGLLECITDGFGFRDKNGNITWYDGYEPCDDESHLSYVVPYGNGADLTTIQN